MSSAAVIFALYFSIGLVLLALAVATPGKERRARHLDVSHGSPLDAGLLLFIALLWPLWLLWRLSQDDPPKY